MFIFYAIVLRLGFSTDANECCFKYFLCLSFTKIVFLYYLGRIFSLLNRMSTLCLWYVLYWWF